MRYWFGSLLALATAIAWSADARATCCSRDSDCPSGFECTGEASPDGGLAGACQFEIRDCRCDSDCPSDFVCVQNAATACPDGDRANCKPIGQCAAPWQAPCGTDADCGAGYRCKANGKLCTGDACQTTTICEPLPLPDACEKDSDCPAGWTCENDDAWADQCVQWRGGCTLSGECPPRAGKNQCRPPDWALVGASQYIGPPPTRAACPAPPADSDAGDEPAENDPVTHRARKRAANADCEVSAPGASVGFSAWPVVLWLATLRRRRRNQARIRTTLR
jgi:hypothetical protein